MKHLALGTLVLLGSWSIAEAKKTGNPPLPIPGGYDYSREKKPGYVKDYCEDSVGNHIYCTTARASQNGTASKFRAFDNALPKQ